jgi:hypothetical protein
MAKHALSGLLPLRTPHLQSAPHWAASARSVKTTVKNNLVCTVSGCGWMERSAKPINEGVVDG